MMQKLLYDAKFSGPRGDLNPMGLKVPGLISVVFREYDRQKAERRKKRRDAKTSGN